MFSFLYSLNSQFNLYAYVTCCTLHSIKITVHQQLQIFSLGILGGHPSSLLRGCCKKGPSSYLFFDKSFLLPYCYLSFISPLWHFTTVIQNSCSWCMISIILLLIFLKINPTRRTPQTPLSCRYHYQRIGGKKVRHLRMKN